MWAGAERLPSRQEMDQVLQQRIGLELWQRFSRSTVAVCGLGGLGSHIAPALARAGVGKLILIDFDQVDLSNINRQQYRVDQVGRYKTQALAENLRQMQPYLALELHTLRLTEENIPTLLSGADLVCEALDQPESKAMLVNTVLERLPQIPVVAASGMAGLGPAEAIRTQRVGSRLVLCGDGESDVEQGESLFAPRVMLCAAQQALAALRILAGEL